MNPYSALQTRITHDELIAPTPPPQNYRIAEPVQASRDYSWSTRLGRESLLIIVIGWLVIVASVAVLIFLWVSDGSVSSWRGLVVSGRATQVITICSAVIRTTMNIQAGILTATVASLVLEHCSVPLRDVAQLSIARASAVAPHNIVLPTLRTVKWRSLQTILVFGLGVAVLVTVASQFISTILLSDLHPRVITGNSTTTDIMYTMERDAFGTNGWLTRPPDYPRFAEYSEPPAEGDRFVDTGPSFRSFLPLRSASERSALRAYQGPAPIFDTRVTCVIPQVEISSIKYSAGISSEMLVVEGSFAVLQDNPPAGLSRPLTDAPRVGFTTVVPITRANLSQRDSGMRPVKYTPEWQVSIHWVDWAAGPRFSSPLNDGRSDSDSDRTDQYLLLNTTGYVEEWLEASRMNWSRTSWTFRDNSVWTTADSNNSDVTISFSLCLNQPVSGDYELLISSDSDGPEPVIEPEEAKKDVRPATEGLRRQLGADEGHQTVKERNVFSLPHPTSLRRIQNPFVPGDVQYGVGIGSRLTVYTKEGGNATNVALMVSEDINSVKGDHVAHPAHVVLFQDILQTTRNPALAMQALLTILFSMRYYDTSFTFSWYHPATLSFSTTVLAPAKWVGFVTVVVIIVVHAILSVLSIAIFVSSTESSIIGNSWQAVAQVVSEDTMPMVEQSASFTEKETKLRLQELGGGEGERYRLIRSSSTGRSNMCAI
ncbi:hypothetical protein BKA66DRAFT_575536 [Pyrenochaeta sp. MPI-SDFR-AT-0127]|nr:hypothetical protein BKA66DRAFT_575536 [Pyrenochaeta sp. MPI-SDFR-AT-0127]